jgi:hypothetical protein
MRECIEGALMQIDTSSVIPEWSDKTSEEAKLFYLATTTLQNKRRFIEKLFNRIPDLQRAVFTLFKVHEAPKVYI